MIIFCIYKKKNKDGSTATGTKPIWAIFWSAVFFAFIHLNPWQAVPAFVLGCLFGYVYYKTGSLKLTMLMHCVNNTLATLLSRIPGMGEAESFMDVLSPWAYWLEHKDKGWGEVQLRQNKI